jgi:hypothetical protein
MGTRSKAPDVSYSSIFIIFHHKTVAQDAENQTYHIVSKNHLATQHLSYVLKQAQRQQVNATNNNYAI